MKRIQNKERMPILTEILGVSVCVLCVFTVRVCSYQGEGDGKENNFCYKIPTLSWEKKKHECLKR